MERYDHLCPERTHHIKRDIYFFSTVYSQCPPSNNVKSGCPLVSKMFLPCISSVDPAMVLHTISSQLGTERSLTSGSPTCIIVTTFASDHLHLFLRSRQWPCLNKCPVVSNV